MSKTYGPDRTGRANTTTTRPTPQTAGNACLLGLREPPQAAMTPALLAGSTDAIGTADERKLRSIPPKAVTIPASEAWLFKNKKALASVLRGLDQAKRMDFADPPNLDEDEKLAAMIPD